MNVTCIMVLSVLLISIGTGCNISPDRSNLFNTEAEVTAISNVLDIQEKAWNDGDIDLFMTTYWQSDSLRFASGGTIRNGWNETLERYKTTYPDKSAMGKLTFSLHSIDLMSPVSAMVFGGYHLQRNEELGDLHGLFTLILEKKAGKWIIVHDHTSAGT